MGFKFFNKQRQVTLTTRERFNDLVEYENRLTTDNRPAVFHNFDRNRGEISDREFEILIMNERRKLIEYMFREGMIIHTIVSQDENGFTLRTEINF